MKKPLACHSDCVAIYIFDDFLSLRGPERSEGDEAISTHWNITYSIRKLRSLRPSGARDDILRVATQSDCEEHSDEVISFFTLKSEIATLPSVARNDIS